VACASGVLAGLHLYEGQLKIIPMQASGKLLDSFNVRYV
jgi:hypothetical protein